MMVEIEIGGNVYNDFSALELTHSVDTLPRYALIRFNGTSKKHAPEGVCNIFLNDDLFFTGNVVSYVDDADSNRVQYDLTLADNTFIASESDCHPREWESTNLSSILRDILSSYNFKIKIEKDKQIDKWSCHPSENLFHNMDCLLDRHNLRALSDGNGSVIVRDYRDKKEYIPSRSIKRRILNKICIPKKVYMYSNNNKSVLASGSGIVKNFFSDGNEESYLKSKVASFKRKDNLMDLILYDNNFKRYDVGQTVTTEGYDNEFILLKKSYTYSPKEGEQITLSLGGAE